MNRSQSNHHSMMKTTNHVFSKYTQEVQSIPAFADHVAEFQNNLTKIDETIAIQEGRITGSAEQKQKEELEMIEATIRLAAGIYVFALDNANFELAEKVNISPSLLRNMGQAKLIAACKNILSLAKGLNGALSDYGISEDDINSLEKEINDFSEIMTSPREQIVTRAEATGRLEKLMKTQLNLLNQKLDKFMLMFKATNPVFYNEFKSARIIVNLGGKHSTEEEAA